METWQQISVPAHQSHPNEWQPAEHMSIMTPFSCAKFIAKYFTLIYYLRQQLSVANVNRKLFLAATVCSNPVWCAIVNTEDKTTNRVLSRSHKQTNKQTTVVWLTVADSNHKLNIRTGRLEGKGSNTQYSSARYFPLHPINFGPFYWMYNVFCAQSNDSSNCQADLHPLLLRAWLLDNLMSFIVVFTSICFTI